MTSSDSGHVWCEPRGRSGWTINGRSEENGSLGQSRDGLDPLGLRLPWLGAWDPDNCSIHSLPLLSQIPNSFIKLSFSLPKLIITHVPLVIWSNEPRLMKGMLDGLSGQCRG